jgi:Uma2 family endonuclease
VFQRRLETKKPSPRNTSGLLCFCEGPALALTSNLAAGYNPRASIMVEIRLPEAKPAYEWVNGRALQKVSPKRLHSIAQGEFSAALQAWARAKRSGVAGPEWRFRLAPQGEVRRPLVPDVAYVSFKRLPYAVLQRTDEPLIAPDAVVEVRSPRERRADIEEKLRIYFATGASVVFLVDPQRKTVTVCDRSGRHVLRASDVVRHAALPGFTLAVRRLFEMPKPRRSRSSVRPASLPRWLAPQSCSHPEPAIARAARRSTARRALS